MDVQDAKQVEAWVTSGDIASAVGELAKHPDLRATDLPPLGKPALKALAANAGAVRQLVLASVHPNVSVRRFARKYVPKAGPYAAAPMLFLAAECMLAMRPVSDAQESLLGEVFEGYSNPLGATIKRNKLSFDPPAPPANYSKADKFAREVLDTLLFLLHATSPAYAVRFVEYCEALDANYRYGEKEEVSRPWEHGDYCLAAVANWDGAPLLQKSPALAEAAPYWLRVQLLLDSPQADPAAEALRQRYLELPQANRTTSPRSLRLWVVRHLFTYKKELQSELLPLIANCGTSPYATDDKAYARYLADWQRRNPGELEKALQPASNNGEAVHLLPAVDLSQAGQERSAAADGLLELAKALKMLDVAAEVKPVAAGASAYPFRYDGDDDEDEDEDEEDELNAAFSFRPAAEKEDAALLRAMLESIGKGKGKTPESALREASWQQHFLAFIQRLAGPYVPVLRDNTEQGWEWHPHQAHAANAAYYALRELHGWALIFLNESGLNSWAALLGTAFENVGMLSYEFRNMVTDKLHARSIYPAELLALVARARHSSVLGDQTFQATLAMLYARPEARSQQMARDSVAKIPAPEGGEYYRRDKCNDPWRWVCWAAWVRRDAEMMANLWERCALSYHTKGKPTIPEAPPNFHGENFAPSVLEKPGVSLEEVWMWLRSALPQRIPGILQTLLPHAEIEELPRVVLKVVATAAPEDLDAVQQQVLPLLESSQPPVAAGALEALRRRPTLARGNEDWVLEALRRCLQSPSAGLAKEAASALGTVGLAWEAHREGAHSLLVEALELETATVLEQVLRSLKEVRGKVVVQALQPSTRERLEELAGKDAKRFDRLTKQLLQS